MITLIFPYYENPQMFRLQQEWWEELGDLEVIVVDDGSPDNPAIDHVVKVPPRFRLYRIKEDVRWNWIAARNLAASEADEKWLLMTDIDHRVTRACYTACLSASSRAVYRFTRVDAPHMSHTNVHANSWLIRRNDFWGIGGYDERFSGWYGSDHDFRHRVSAAYNVLHIREPLIRYGRKQVKDASTTRYQRKTPEDRENVKRIKRERKELKDWRPLTLTFPWERLI